MCSACVRHNTDCSYPRHNAHSNHDREVTKCTPRASTTPPETSFTPVTKNGPASTLHNLNLEDLELLHQYITSTCIATSQRPEVTTEIQQSVPQLAEKNPFVMHGILAKAAIHLSRLRPARQRHYFLLAAKHHGHALPEFRSALQEINEDNYSALITYSFTLVWCAFAGYPVSFASEGVLQSIGGVRWLPGWFCLLRGSCLIVQSCAAWNRSATHVPPQADDWSTFLRSHDNHRLNVLRADLMSTSQAPTYGRILSILHHSFILASMHHQNTPLRKAINFWVGNLPSEYFRELQREDPWALVLMAHFCIIVHRSETRWFMRGQAAQLLQAIVDRLHGSWHRHILWPIEAVGLHAKGVKNT